MNMNMNMSCCYCCSLRAGRTVNSTLCTYIISDHFNSAKMVQYMHRPMVSVRYAYPFNYKSRLRQQAMARPSIRVQC